MKFNGRWIIGSAKVVGLEYIVILLAALMHAAYGAITLSHENAIKHEGEMFMVTCKDNSGRQVEWSGPKGALGEKTLPKVDVASYGTSIVFKHLSVKDTGDYICKAGEDHRKFHLIVKRPLTFMDTSPVQTGREYSPVTLRCEVKGDHGEKPFVTWSADNKNLDDPRYVVIGDGLLIQNVTRADNKTFTCKAMLSSTGEIREQQIQFKVEHQPVFKHPLYAKSEDAWGFIGGEVNLTCEVDAEPAPTFEWYWMKKPLKHKHRIHDINSHKSVLQINITDARVFGNYRCMAENKVGTLEKFFTLQQGVQADAPEFIERRGVNADLLDIGIHGPKNKEKLPLSQRPIGYRLLYRARTDKTWLAADFDINEENSYPLLNLNPNTEYLVKAATRNKSGLSNYTDASAFRTTAENYNSAPDDNQPKHAIIICMSLVSLMINKVASSIPAL